MKNFTFLGIIMIIISIFMIIMTSILNSMGHFNEPMSPFYGHYESQLITNFGIFIFGLLCVFLPGWYGKNYLREKAKQREKALDYDTAITIWEELKEFDEAARVRKLKVKLTKSPNSDVPPSKTEQIKEYKELLDSGAIDEYEFKQMKKEILGK